MSKNIFVVMLVISSFLASCGHKQVTYSPINNLSQKDSLATLNQLLREQIQKGTKIQNVEVTNEYFKVAQSELKNTKLLFINKGKISIDNSVFVYFNAIAKAQIYYKRSWVVIVQDSVGKTLYRFTIHREDKAKLFADVMMSLANSIKK